MPSFDFSSEVDMVALKNAIDVTGKKIIGRHDFKGCLLYTSRCV